MDVESEIKELKQRVGDLEGAVNVLGGQIGKVNPNLAALALKSTGRFNRVEELVGKVAGRLDLMSHAALEPAGRPARSRSLRR